MEDLKIRVNSEAESEEAQCLFFELGYRWLGGHGSSYFKINDNFKYITAYMRGMSLAQGANGDAKKEITMLQLRDMVVLKRNDVGDANYKTNYGTQCYITGEDVYAFQDNKWFLSAMQHKDILDMIKPIEKPMKEYLFKYNDQYTLVELSKEDAGSNPEQYIEVPEGENA